LCFPPQRRPGRGRPPRHGRDFKLADPASCPAPAVTTTTQTARYGTAVAQAWDRLHPRLTRRSAWLGHDGDLPVIDGTLIRLQVDHLPGDRHPKPMWLWSSRTGAMPAEVDRLWQAFLRRFDLEMSKPQCCHICGLSALPLAPFPAVVMVACWLFSQGRRRCCPRGVWWSSCRRSTSAGSARTTVSLARGCR